MASQRTWVWILVGVAGAAVIAVVAVAGAGIYFVTRHIHTTQTNAADALRSFDHARSRFVGATPLYEMDSANEPRPVRPLADLPTSPAAATHLELLAWDPDDERLVQVSLPIWLLRFGRHKMSIESDGHGFNLEHLDLDARQLERIGATLLFDFRDQDGVRVLVWTQ
jgi:hypothetical protein